MNTAILDSSALVALLIENDADHAKAVAAGRAVRKMGALILVPPEVVSETLNIVGKMRGRDAAIDAGRPLFTDPDLHFLDTSVDRMRDAVTRWEKQGSGVSYTDCVVMAAADEAETSIIYGFDAVFAKNGYQLPEGEAKV